MWEKVKRELSEKNEWEKWEKRGNNGNERERGEKRIVKGNFLFLHNFSVLMFLFNKMWTTE